MKRVFLYVRVSTEEQAVHGLSIEAQTLALEEWAKANGHQVVDLYVDAGISARKPATKRPELQRLLLDVQSGKGELSYSRSWTDGFVTSLNTIRSKKS